MQIEDANAGSAEAIEPVLEVNQPNPPPPPVTAAQTFECDKCGATFADEGSAAAHIQTCKGPDVMPEEEGEKATSAPNSQADEPESHRTEARGSHIAFTVAA